MICEPELNALKYKLSLIPLQILNKNEQVSFENIKVLKDFFKCYRLIIYQLHNSDKDRWTNLFDIGLKELDDHMKILVTATNPNLQSENYNDCHNYLTSSIQDALDTKKDIR